MKQSFDPLKPKSWLINPRTFNTYFRTWKLFSFFLFFPSKVLGSFFHRSFGFKSENKNCCSWLTSLKLESFSLFLFLSLSHTHTYTHKDQNRDTVVQALARFVLFNFFTLLFFVSQSEREIRSKKIRCWKTTHCSLGKLTTPLLLVFYRLAFLCSLCFIHVHTHLPTKIPSKLIYEAELFKLSKKPLSVQSAVFYTKFFEITLKLNLLNFYRRSKLTNKALKSVKLKQYNSTF